MASVSNDGNGRRRIQFIHPDGRRLAIRLGKVSQRTADSFARRVEQLLECLQLKQPMDADLSSWVAALTDDLAAKLAKHRLVPSRTKSELATIADFITRYVDGRHDVKPATKEIWRQGERGLVNFWGPKKPLIEITEGDAEAYKQHLITEGLAPATIRKRLYFASLIFRSAVKFRLIPSNPFTDVRVKVPPPGRKHFITQEETERLIDACPNEDWRVIIALSRYGGLRCPSEVLSLRWSDIVWDSTHGVMHVRSPKTEHHPGKESRVVPIFGVLKPHLERAFEAAAEGSVYIVAESLRQSSLGPSGWRKTNLRKPFLAVIKKAGMKPWPRLFHNLRSSRETELMANHAPHDVCTWIGNSLAIAQRHYLQVTQAAIARAVAEPGQTAQNPAQHLLAPGRTEQKATSPPPAQTPEITARDKSMQNPANHQGGGHGIRTHNPFRGI